MGNAKKTAARPPLHDPREHPARCEDCGESLPAGVDPIDAGWIVGRKDGEFICGECNANEGEAHLSARNAKRIAKRIASDWLPNNLDSDQRSLVGTVSRSLEWDTGAAGAFAVALLEDVNMHPEAAELNSILTDDDNANLPDWVQPTPSLVNEGTPYKNATYTDEEMDIIKPNPSPSKKSMPDLFVDLRKALESSLTTLHEIHRIEIPSGSGENWGLHAWEDYITRMIASLYRSGPSDR